MFGTITSLLFALFLYFNTYEISYTDTFPKAFMITSALIFLLFVPFGIMFSWMPMQKAEQNSTPRIMEMLKLDNHIKIAGLWLFVFTLITFILLINPTWIDAIPKRLVFPLWILLFGISFDASLNFIYRIASYLNPFSVVKMFKEKAMGSIRADRELDLCGWIDALSEVAIKNVHRHSTSIAHLAIQEEQILSKSFLEASKSISHQEFDKQMKSAGINDKISFVMFYLYQRLDILFEKALANKLEPTCTYVITTFGKIAVDAAKFDMTLASVPLRYLGKCAKKAQDEGLEETSGTAACVLFEVAKQILTEVDISYYDIKDPFLSIINGMETLEKGAFQRDKNISIPLLMQPFKDLLELFKTGKAKDHQDSPVIVQNIERVLGEFEALLLVMNTMPTISSFEEEEKKPQ